MRLCCLHAVFSATLLLAASSSLAAASPQIGDHELLLLEEFRARNAKCGHPDAVNTTERLANLRSLMRDNGLEAYIITSNDDHQSEYVAEHDRRREFISGFSGSAGDAVVTLDHAALWTDSRYFLQAERQLDCNWQLMRTGLPETPSMTDWISSVVNNGSRVSTDPRITAYSQWTAWNTTLSSLGLQLVLHSNNLVDAIWGPENGQPDYPADPVFVLESQFTGPSWREKLAQVRELLAQKDSEAIVLTALDEIAWVLNLRGADVPFTPVFRAYLVVGVDWATLYLPAGKSTPSVENHLNSASTDLTDSVQIQAYESIWQDLETLGNSANKVILPGPYSYARGASYLVHSHFDDSKIIENTSPVLLMKDIKNEVEALGMRSSHVRDAVALCQTLALIEKEVSQGIYWDEMKAVNASDSFRARQNFNMGPSFGTIAAFGPNSALPHYEPSDDTNLQINQTSTLLIDSGGQYLDGTTDVTRTMHYGSPTSEQRTVYTKLLIGCITIATTTFPEGNTLRDLEILIRAPLYSLGLDYGHGSTHGIGSFLGVHEAFNQTFHLNFFGSQEPGYYKENDFGMRLENIVTVVPANVTGDSTRKFLTFETVTLVPYESNLIDTSLMSKQQLAWLNAYHSKVLQVVGDALLTQGDSETYNWLVQKTIPLE